MIDYVVETKNKIKYTTIRLINKFELESKQTKLTKQSKTMRRCNYTAKQDVILRLWM